MRDFIIKGLEWLIGFIAVLAALGVLGIYVLLEAAAESAPVYPSGPPASLIFLIAGLASFFLIFGLIYVLLGIYDNTKRSAEALEALVKKQS